MRAGLPLVRRARRGPAAPTSRTRSTAREGVHPLPAARPGARDHAVELPLLAGVPLRRARAHGGQRRPAQARVERAAVRAGHRGRLAPRGLPGGRVPDAAGRLAARSRRIIEDPRVARRDAHRQRGRGPRGRRHARARTIKKSVLELGGSDPFIVMPSRRPRHGRRDGGARRARSTTASPASTPSGSSCTRQIADEFVRRMVARLESLKLGDPMDPDTDIGPLASPDAVEEIDRAGAATRSPRAPGCTPAASRSAGRAASTRRRCSPTSPTARRPTTRSCSARWPLVWRARTSTTPSASPTTPTFGLGGSAWTADPAEQERFATESRPA